MTTPDLHSSFSFLQFASISIEEELEHSMGNDQSIKLLVVDDQEGYFRALEEVAEMCGHQFQIECRHSDNTEAALNVIDDWTPSVIIVDAHLTDSHCYDFV